MEKNLQIKLEQELQVVETMMKVYCKGNKHQQAESGLCEACQELLEYAKVRSNRCPRKEQKTFCNTCPIHCYKPVYRQQMKEVMKYAGPRMLYKHPLIAIKHMMNTYKEKVKKQ